MNEFQQKLMEKCNLSLNRNLNVYYYVYQCYMKQVDIDHMVDDFIENHNLIIKKEENG